MKEATLHPMGTVIHPRSVEGRFRRIKTIVLLVAYGVYFGLPWLSWHREVGPDQAVLFDLAQRKFYMFGLVMQPEQIFWLAGFLVIAALLLFFITSIGGRIFCGYFCFQTLWSDLFFQIERLVQGERPARLRLEKQAWNAEKFRKKGLTWLLFGLAAFWTGMSFTLYWGDAGDLLLRFFTGDAPVPMYITVLILTISTFVMAGFAREAVCNHMCPYSRFQSAMLDNNTRIVTYDRQRGESIHGRAKPDKQLKLQADRSQAGVGDCVDCGYCVQVCPTGIDIREGMQIGCIHCALCIDACDNIMEHMGWPKGLIRYSSHKEDSGEQASLWTPKNIGYGASLVLMTALLIFSMATKPPLETSIYQTRNPLYVELSDGRIQNSYEIKLSNQSNKVQTWTLSLQNLDDAELDIGRVSEITVQPLQFVNIYAKVKRKAPKLDGRELVEFQFLASPSNVTELRPAEIKASFYSP